MHRSSILSTAFAALGLAMSAGALATSASAATTLPTASYGQAEVAVVRDPANSAVRQLTYTAAADQPPIVVAATLPAKVERIGLGLDARGLLTAVVQTPSGLSWIHVTKPKAFKRIPNTRGATGAAIYRGRVAYICQRGLAVCGASLRTKARRVLLRRPQGSQWYAYDVRIGEDSAIAVREVRDGSLGATQVRIKRVGEPAKRIAEANLDGAEDLFLRDISPDGGYLTLVRERYGDATTTQTVELFRFPSGEQAS